MKKVITTITILSCMIIACIAPLQASTSREIIISIKGAEHMYLISLEKQTMKVKSISTNLYTKISCLDNEKSTLKSVDFNKAPTCLINTIDNTLSTNIDNYIILDMKALLKDVGIKDNEYDYATLASLTKVSKKILDKIKPSLFVHYQKYVDTDLALLDIYDLYQFFKRDDFKTKYYHLQYFVNKENYLLFDVGFHLQKSLKK